MAVLRVLVVNAGSSSLKLRLLDPGDRVVGSQDLPAPTGAADAGTLKDAISSLGREDLEIARQVRSVLGDQT